MLDQKQIVLGVGGSIAAYKSVEILRALCRLGAVVTVVMTKNALEFISPLTFQTLSGQKTVTTLFDSKEAFRPEHIALSQKADLVLVAPATANLIGKFAGGIADDSLTSLFLSVRSPILLAPAMNPAMYANPFVQRNLRLLEEREVGIIEPAVGEVACGEGGQGRLAPVEDIIDRVVLRLGGKSPLRKTKVLISAGPTREYLDPVRYISNGSSGKMGFALARAAYLRGAQVTLVSGPNSLPRPCAGIEYIPVTSTLEMMQALEQHFPSSSVTIMAAAVSDFRPVRKEHHKIKKSGLSSHSLELEKTPDILRHLGRIKTAQQILVGFAAETEKLLAHSLGKLEEKNLDLICGNDITQEGAGFDTDTNILTLIDSRREVVHLPLLSKEKAALRVIEKVESLLLEKSPSSTLEPVVR
ncbi:MAG: bifunctional phosphopantothenoylcysteine decarboxylase/phosphopantothenate--cysteine ligase CoaBC [bacterium]